MGLEQLYTSLIQDILILRVDLYHKTNIEVIYSVFNTGVSIIHDFPSEKYHCMSYNTPYCLTSDGIHTFDNPMDDCSIVITFETELNKVPASQWTLFRPQLYVHLSYRSFQQNLHTHTHTETTLIVSRYQILCVID